VRAIAVSALSALVAVGACSVGTAFAQNPPAGTHWVGTWTTAPTAQPATATYSTAFSNQTLRQIIRVSLGGSEVRVRLSNAFGGSKSVTLWPGALILSDPVKLDVPALAHLAVSTYLPGDVPANLPITFHNIAKQTNYVSPSGDHTDAVDMPVATTKQSWYFLTGVDLAAPRSAGAVVAFGDSLTEGNLSTADTDSRWTDALAMKLQAGGLHMGVMNEGIGGGRLLHDVNGESGLHRFDRDVLAQPGVTHVIVLLGINDLRRRLLPGAPESEPVSADDMIAGYQQFILRAHARGIKIIGVTLLPWESETFAPDAYTPEAGAKRHAINTWIRWSGAFDGVMDFDKLLQDPAAPGPHVA
jgi:lysophospholipase L1-like esterase